METAYLIKCGEKESFKIAEKPMQTCHMQGIKYGSLAPNDYGSYTVQDAIFCYQSTDLYRRLAEKAKDTQIKEFAELQYASYKEYTEDLFERWYISDPSGIKLSPGPQKYINYKSEVLDKYKPLYFIVANMPCLHLWCWLANQLKDRMEGPANLYSFWIRDNLDDKSVRILEKFVDEKANKLNVNDAISIYKECMKGEFEFFALAKGKEIRFFLQEGDFLLPGDILFSKS